MHYIIDHEVQEQGALCDLTNPVTFNDSCYHFDLRDKEQIMRESGITRNGARNRLRRQVNQPEKSGNQDTRREARPNVEAPVRALTISYNRSIYRI